MNNYFIFKLNKKPIISIPVGGNLSLTIKAINCFPDFTTKRKLYKIFMKFFCIFLHPYFKFFYSNKFICKTYEEWIRLSKLSNSLNNVFIWSPIEERGRFYIHSFDELGNKLLFTKLTTCLNDFDLIRNEYEFLKYFEKRKKSFKTPSIKSFEENEHLCYLTVESIPDNYKLFHPEFNKFPIELIKEFQQEKENLTLSAIFNLNWVKNELNNNYLFSIFKYLKNLQLNTPIELSVGHGDFGGENIYINNEKNFMIIDWERGTKFAPILLDKLSFWLGKNHYYLKNNDFHFQNFLLEFENENKYDIALSIIFLVNVNYDLVFILLNKLNEKNFFDEDKI